MSGVLQRRISICIVHLIERLATSPPQRCSYKAPICWPSIDGVRIVVTTLNCWTRLFLSRASTVTCGIKSCLGGGLGTFLPSFRAASGGAAKRVYRHQVCFPLPDFLAARTEC